MQIVGVIQARMGSTRLPGKVMADVGGRPLLRHVIERSRRSQCLGDLWIATSTHPRDDQIETLAHTERVKVYRGSLEDVLSRYVMAAQLAGADLVVRLTGDSPFLEPVYVSQAVQLALESHADLVCARDPDHIVPGTGCEVITQAALAIADQEGRTQEDREHVTWYLLAHRDRFRVVFLHPPDAWENPGIRLTVDEVADLALIRAIYARLAPQDPAFGLTEILQLFRSDPSLFQRNQKVKPRPHLFREARMAEV